MARNIFEGEVYSGLEDEYLTQTYGSEKIHGFTIHVLITSKDKQVITPVLFELNVYADNWEVADSGHARRLHLVSPLYEVNNKPLNEVNLTFGDKSTRSKILIKGYGFSPKAHKRLDKITYKASRYINGSQIEFYETKKPLIVDAWLPGHRLELGKKVELPQSLFTASTPSTPEVSCVN